MPAVSVIIPTYNRSSLVHRAVSSALAQTYRDIEVIVCDDGSTDDTGATIRAIDDPRLIYLKLDRSGLVAQARNAGIRMARGKYVAFLDSDDRWSASKLELQLAGLELAPDACACCTDVGRTDEPVPTRKPRRTRIRLRRLLKHNSICTSSMLIETKAVLDIGAFDPSIGSFGEDYDLWLRILDRRDRSVVRLHAALVHYSTIDGSLSSRYRERNNAVERLVRLRPTYARLTPRRATKRRLRSVDRSIRALRLRDKQTITLSELLTSGIGPLWVLRVLKYRLSPDSVTATRQ